MRCSFSKLDSLDSCPLRFAHRYIWHTQVEPEPDVSVAARRGVALHATFEKVAKEVLDGSRDPQADPRPAMVRIVNEELVREGVDPVAGETAEVAAASIQQFAGASLVNTIAVEHSFSVQIGHHELVGQIDRIEEFDNGLIVVTDYKTGKVRDQWAADFSLQLTIYAYAASVEFSIPLSGILLCMDFVRHGKKFFTTRTEADVAEIIRRADSAEHFTEQVEAGKLQPIGRYSGLCDYCEFRAICPVYEQWRNINGTQGETFECIKADR